MTQLDLNRVRQSIKNQIGSKIKISANRGRHKFVTAKGVITQTYPNIFLVELENADGNDQINCKFQLPGRDHKRCPYDVIRKLMGDA